MTRKLIDTDRQRIFAEYMVTLQDSDLAFNTKGRYAEGVFMFLKDVNAVNRRGYKEFMKNNAKMIADRPWIKDSLLHFLASRGMGYHGRRIPGKSSNSETKIMERIETRQQRVINDFIVWLQSGFDYSSNTIKAYVDTVRQFFGYCEEFSQDNARRYIATLEAKGMKPQTIRLRITGVEKLAKFLRKPCKLKRPNMQKTLSVEDVPTEKEYNILLSWLDRNNRHWAFVVRLMGTTGCRVSELVQFTYEMVSQGHCTLKGKGSKYRQFFFTKEMQEQAKGKCGLICVNRYGDAISTRGIAYQLKVFADKSGIQRTKIHPHAFRHFFAKMYLKKTKDVVSLSDILGHGSVDITRIYLKKTQDEQKRDYNRVVTW